MLLLFHIVLAFGTVPGFLAIFATIVGITRIFRAKKLHERLFNVVVTGFTASVCASWAFLLYSYLVYHQVSELMLRQGIICSLIPYILYLTVVIGARIGRFIKRRFRHIKAFGDIHFAPLGKPMSDEEQKKSNGFWYAVSILQIIYSIGLLVLYNML